MAGPPLTWLRRARVAVLAGVAVVALAWGAVTPVGRIVLAVTVVAFALLLTFGYALQRRLDRRFPPVLFHPQDAAAVEDLVEAARTNLKPEGAVAFSIAPLVDEIVDADGQIWFRAADGGATTMELALPHDVDTPEEHPGVVSLINAGWRVEDVRPGEWILLMQPGLAASVGLPTLVAETLADLFEIPPTTLWECRRFT